MEPSQIHASNKDIHCPDKNNCYVVGGLASILKFKPEIPSPIRKRTERDPIRLGPNGALVYRMNRSGNVSIRLLDIRGKVARKIFKGKQKAGEHNLQLPSMKISAGAYILELRTDEYQKAIRVDRR